MNTGNELKLLLLHKAYTNPINKLNKILLSIILYTVKIIRQRENKILESVL